MLLSSTPPRMRSGPRMVPIVGSILAHAIFFAWLFAAPSNKDRSAYAQLIKPEETHLIWYNFKRKLPDVSPRNRASRDLRLKAETIEKQSIVSSPKDAPKAPQMIFRPVPVLKPQPVAPLPNIIALAAPPPPQKQFIPPKPVEAKRETKPLAELEKAPELTAKVNAPELPQLPKVSRPFTPPAERAPKLQMKVQTVEAPQLQPGAAAAVSSAAAKVLDQGSRTLAFRPQPKRSLTASVGALPDAPAVQGGSSSNANVAVIGLNPIDKLNVPLPEGSRRAQFSAGPKLNPDGALSAGKSSGIAVPDVTIRGGDKDAASNLIAQTMSPAFNAPSSLESLRASAKEASRRSSGENPRGDIGRPTGTRVSGAPDPRFLGRQVFSVAIQSPNLTSHVGSWLMWYADRTERAYQVKISAPEPLHKVDPRYVATAVEERVEGTVRLAFVISADGRVYGIERVKGIDDRLDTSAMEALKKWEFTPAMLDGKPIAVDALVEIPFRLAAPEPK